MNGLIGAPNTILGRPVSKMVAPTLAVAAEARLVFTPTSSGDSWMKRTLEGVDSMKAGYSFSESWIGTDGQNVGSVFADQVEQNSGSALLLAGESVALGFLGRLLGA